MSDQQAKIEKDIPLELSKLAAGAITFVLLAYWVFCTHWQIGFLADTEAWARFGEYFGGVGGTILNFVVFIGFLMTMKMQAIQIKHSETLLEHSQRQLEFTRQQFEDARTSSAQILEAHQKMIATNAAAAFMQVYQNRCDAQLPYVDAFIRNQLPSSESADQV